jgi:hypothetical protein
LFHRDELAADHDPAVATERSPLPVDPKLLLVCETSSKRGRQSSEGTLTSMLKMSSARPRRGERRADSTSPSSESLMILRNQWHGRDQTYPMPLCDQVELASQRCEGAGLDLDQQVAADDVDDKTVDELLDAVAAVGTSL